MCTQLALQAVLDYKPPDGGRVSAVSYSWGLDERNTDRSEMQACDKLMKALLDKVGHVQSGSGFRVSACHVGIPSSGAQWLILQNATSAERQRSYTRGSCGLILDFNSNAERKAYFSAAAN
jgi:hypothetical protein